MVLASLSSQARCRNHEHSGSIGSIVTSSKNTGVPAGIALVSSNTITAAESTARASKCLRTNDESTNDRNNRPPRGNGSGQKIHIELNHAPPTFSGLRDHLDEWG